MRTISWVGVLSLLASLVVMGCGGDGTDGSDGTDGADGPSGTDGTDGTDGSNALVAITAEPAGGNCEFSGQKVQAGTDSDGDGMLDPEEVDAITYICEACDGEEECNPFVEVAQSAQTGVCVTCHSSTTPALVERWQRSGHYPEAVGCFECHQAAATDVDAMSHNGETIAILVTPDDCGTCHAQASAEFESSHHAQAGQILGSLDNRLAEVIEGDLSFHGASPVSVMGCAYCHGSEIEVEPGGTLAEHTYPNSGIGRINPDGSLGACSACHMRHDFSPAQARRPENCGRCHVGPDHPHIEIYNESQHGILFYANEEDMALDSETWVVGEDYSAAPTCATCHMGATSDEAGTHDVGTRLSWVLRSPVSSHTSDWETKRGSMQGVCGTCHSTGHVEAFFAQLDAGVALYNEKFALPAKAIHDAVRGGVVPEVGPSLVPLVSTDTFDDEIEWAYWYLWHHEGRRARAGMAMVGPDYVQWHGFYDIAERFYFDLVPEAQHLAEGALLDGDATNDATAQAILDYIEIDVMCRPEHTWFGRCRAP